MTWQGSVGINGVGVITNFQEIDTEPMRLFDRNEKTDFCEKGLVPEGVIEGPILSELTHPWENEDDLSRKHIVWKIRPVER